ncbi:uncharacterized protein BYT42DRAFT_497862 [Radiomyces spectabilis]|uniref:uncharacterized protein n=1 Tax=Radiomyces spectabilis TaxID=64574 RepID=UPI00221E4FC8|nr:uncharacterized protein BYT42DRAFT_497862 [Radiomyces spectabilis]KAI8376005.1 hypothetical protein BYT42DRAFT_497862 [Radiomyces spectabilis]
MPKGKKPYKSWLKDGIHGGPSSMEVLVNWLATKGNYARWRGDRRERIPKKVLIEEIIDRMRQVGIYHRLPKDVASKISTLQSSYRSAQTWLETQGEKMQQNGQHQQKIREEILKRFPYWDQLHPVFGRSRPESAWAMSIRSLVHAVEDCVLQQQQQQQQHKRTMDEMESDVSDISDESEPTKRDKLSSFDFDRPSTELPHPWIVPLNKLDQRESLLATSLVTVSREKEAGRMKRSRDMLEFLREKRERRDRLLAKLEQVRRIEAKAQLVKSMKDAGFTKAEMIDQLNRW